MAAVRSLILLVLTFYDNCITAFHNGVLANNGDITPRYPMWIYINTILTFFNKHYYFILQ